MVAESLADLCALDLLKDCIMEVRQGRGNISHHPLIPEGTFGKITDTEVLDNLVDDRGFCKIMGLDYSHPTESIALLKCGIRYAYGLS
jgi:hypothetical protein